MLDTNYKYSITNINPIVNTNHLVYCGQEKRSGDVKQLRLPPVVSHVCFLSNEYGFI